MRTSRPFGLWHHGAPRPISSVKGCTTPAAPFMGAPASLTGKNGVMETVKRAGTSAIDKGSVAHEGDVVEAKVPDGGVSHAVGAECHHGTNYCASDDIVLFSIISVIQI